MSPVLQLSAPSSNARGRSAKAPARPAAARRKKVWTGARKRLASNPLQMSLPGLGQVL